MSSVRLSHPSKLVSSISAKIFSVFLTVLAVPTIKIGARSVRSIEQGSAETGCWLCAMIYQWNAKANDLNQYLVLFFFSGEEMDPHNR